MASDVLASAVSAYTYGKNKNLDIKNGIVMMISVLCFTMMGRKVIVARFFIIFYKNSIKLPGRCAA